MNFTFDGINQAKENINRIQEVYSKIIEGKSKTGIDTDISSITIESKKAFEEALDDDLDMPVALASIFKFVRDMNKYLETNQVLEENKLEITDYFETIDKVLGILSDKTIELDDDVRSLIEQRDEARIKKDWKKSDEIREELLKKGFIVEDTKEGTRIKRK